MDGFEVGVLQECLVGNDTLELGSQAAVELLLHCIMPCMLTVVDWVSVKIF